MLLAETLPVFPMLLAESLPGLPVSFTSLPMALVGSLLVLPMVFTEPLPKLPMFLELMLGVSSDPEGYLHISPGLDGVGAVSFCQIPYCVQKGLYFTSNC